MRPPKNKLMTSRKRERNQAGTWKCRNFCHPCRFLGRWRGIPPNCSLWFWQTFPQCFLFKMGEFELVSLNNLEFTTFYRSFFHVTKSDRIEPKNLNSVGSSVKFIFGLHENRMSGVQTLDQIFLEAIANFQVMPNIFCFGKKRPEP